jgi:hypothetical protein
MLVRCRRNDGVKGRTQSRWRSSDHRRHLVFSSTACTVRIDFSSTTARPCAAPGEVCVSYPLPQKSAGLFRRPQIESTGKFRQGGIRPASARIQGTRSCPRQCCTRRRCALATDRRMSSHQGIAGGRHIRSVPAHGHTNFNGSAERVGSAQESSSRAYSAAVPSVRSNAYVGRPGCMDRPHAAVGRSAAQWCSRGGLECIGQRWRGDAKAA